MKINKGKTIKNIGKYINLTYKRKNKHSSKFKHSSKSKHIKSKHSSKSRHSKSRHSKKKFKKGGDKKSFKKAQCAPKKTDEIQEFSCYSKDALFKMRDLWNKRHSDSLIKSENPNEIWNHLKKKMENACHTEACWLKQKFMENNLNDELVSYTFAPKSPLKWKENHTTWLNSTDIEKVMKQYEHAYPCFRFIGPTPIDFDKHVYNNKCVWDDLCNFELSKFKKEGITKIGIIFNTDTHDKSGSHWISLFINLKKNFIFFFDSNGVKMPPEVKQFCERVTGQALKLGIKLTLDQNAPFIHQEGNTECGMYSLYLIVTLLEDTHPYSFFKNTKISDAAMEKMRDHYYNNDL
jgi:hypothetical protein